MPDRNPNLPVFRFLLAALPLVSMGVYLTVKADSYVIIGILAAALSTVGVIIIIIRYESELVQAHRDTRVRLQSAAHELNTFHLLANIVEGISDPLILLDLDRQVVQANGAARELLGKQIVGQDIAFHLRHPDVLRAIERASREGVAAEMEITLTNPVTRDCLMRAKRFEGPPALPGGSPRHYIIISLYDISKIKLAEKMRVDFVANASHELRTPLASLSGFIETLQDIGDEDGETRKNFLKIMENEAGRMRRLIDDLLSLSRIEMNLHVPPEQSVELAPLLKGVAQAMKMHLKERHNSIIFDIKVNIPAVCGDRDQLVQVFTNLLDNAIKYGRQSEAITVSISLCDRLPNCNDPGVLVKIFNPGEGIPPQHVPRLTERFYRVDAARSRQMGGTGLGLAIVKHIINRHRGFLKIESEINRGTTVTIGLPQMRARPLTS